MPLSSCADISSAEVDYGLLGELQVEEQLVRCGWHPVRLNAAGTASNSDLLAVKGLSRVSIQVKTTDAENKHSHSQSLGFGYSTSYLRDAKSIFNSKDGPFLADIVVGVACLGSTSRFVILPVAFAEKICRVHLDWWFGVPTRTDTGKRSHSFPIYLNFSGEPISHRDHHMRMRRNLEAYEGRWDLLSAPVERLHDGAYWAIID